MTKRNHDTLPFDTVRLESALFVPDLFEKIVRGVHTAQRVADYHVPKGLKLHDEHGRAFQIATAQWKSFALMLDRTDIDILASTQHFIQELLQDTLGYSLEKDQTITLSDRTYHLSFLAYDSVPIFVAPSNLTLDDVSPLFTVEGSGNRNRSIFRLAQEFLNASVDCTWALVTNGRRIRLLRDSSTLTRPCFLEFDLETILAGKLYPDYAALWRTLHSSRAGAFDKRGTTCIWEQWRTEGQSQGTRVWEGLRYGVTNALVALGNGFLNHPANTALHTNIHDGNLSADGYFQELLRLVYRCLFLFTLEERKDEQTDISLLHTPDISTEAQEARNIYRDGYSLKRLRNRVLRSRGRDRYDDLWQGLVVVFRALYKGEPRLALPALGGLFTPKQCRNLDSLSLPNQALLEAIFSLRWAYIDGNLSPVDYRNMGPEELGSVYESLLELVPAIDLPARKFDFVGITEEGDSSGHTRKTTGSYYTPDSLVQELIRSALDPVIETRLASRPDNPTEALLSITVIDPACGSGHFLLAAARRLAEHLAELRSVDGAVRPDDYRHALREVIAHCIYGVDKNPMALELARTALWLEGFEPGRPLSFLNHHLVCGDALLGVINFQQIQAGIPKEAFKKLSGDDASLCRDLGKGNRENLKTWNSRMRQGYLFPQKDLQDNWQRFAAIEKLPSRTVKEVEEKSAAYRAFLTTAEKNPLQHALDCYVGAFLARKTPEAVPPPSTADLLTLLFADPPDADHLSRLQEAQQLCRDNQVFHWPLIFPQITEKGGFDCVLANPPWERIKLQEEEFFASRHQDVAAAKNKAERGQRIAWLGQGVLATHLTPEIGMDERICEAEKRVYREFIVARRTSEATSLFAHLKEENNGRFPLTGVGDVNTYALFAETISQLITPDGRAGFIVPTGIATDDSTKKYFSAITQDGRLTSLYDFENREAIFPGVHRSYKFCLLTLGENEEAQFSFFLTKAEQLADERRSFALQPEDFSRINPNTGTCPIFRCRMDAELTRKIYRRVPVMIREPQGEGTNYRPEENPWGIRFMRMFDMANDSHLFVDTGEQNHLPLYEAKMIHQFDHRWASYHRKEDGTPSTADVTIAEKKDPNFAVTPRYWVDQREVFLRIARLPKDMLKALQGRDMGDIALATAHFLFGQWLHHQGCSSAATAMNKLYPTWMAFSRRFPFTAHISPTLLGFCNKKPAGGVVTGPHCLPGMPISKITSETKANWFAANEHAVQVLLDDAMAFPNLIDVTPTLRDIIEVLSFTEELMEATSPRWLLGWRDICRSTDERTVIASVVPRVGVGHTMPLLSVVSDAFKTAAFMANINSIILDFIARQKVGGIHLTYSYFKQFPILPPEYYTESDLTFIVPRVLELTYTSDDMRAWAEDLEYTGPPFPYNPEHRARLRAELDAYYARLYGLSRDELRYILDPEDIMGDDYPSETFRVLKNNELRNFGEYRTQRLILEAWDTLELIDSTSS